MHGAEREPGIHQPNVDIASAFHRQTCILIGALLVQAAFIIAVLQLLG